MKNYRETILTLTLCAILGAGTLGCNTFRGAGKDIQKGGEAVENAADKASDNRGERRGGRHGYGHSGAHIITASADTGGMVSPSGKTSVANRSSQTYTVRASSGYHVADVLIDGKSVGAVGRHTFADVTSGHSIAAVFTPNPIR